jgi:DNA-binding transcriptional LysR family regulator
MKGMEEALGTALLERHRRGVRPTPAGHALFHHSQLVLAQIEITRRSPQLWPMPSGLDHRFSDVTQS